VFRQRATALFIPFQRHPATLAILIRMIHNFEDRLNLLALFLSSFPFQIIRDFGKLGLLSQHFSELDVPA
jgi:hypothetical protein